MSTGTENKGTEESSRRYWRLGLLLAAGAVFLIVMLTGFGGRTQTLVLPDGVEVRLVPGKAGKTVRFHSGNIFQKTVYRLVGTNAPVRFRGDEEEFTATHLDGATGVLLSLAPLSGIMREPVNGDVALVWGREDGAEVPGLRRMVRFNTGKMPDGRTLVTGEDIFWEFPAFSGERAVITLYHTNRTSGRVLRHEFTVRNHPARRK